jgi:hypothetical protein
MAMGSGVIFVFTIYSLYSIFTGEKDSWPSSGEVAKWRSGEIEKWRKGKVDSLFFSLALLLFVEKPLLFSGHLCFSLC